MIIESIIYNKDKANDQRRTYRCIGVVIEEFQVSEVISC